MQKSEMMTVREVAAGLGVAPFSVWRWIAAGKIKGAVKVGRGWRISPVVLKDYLVANSSRSKKEPY